MAKQVERGSKRVCSACSNKFYDLNRTPLTCPSCGAAVALEKPAKAREPAEDKNKKAAEKAAEKVVEKAAEKVAEKVAEDDAPVVAAAAEVISLEEAEAAEADEDSDVEDEENLADIETDDVEISADDDNTFLVEEDEGEADVSGIVGDPAKKREES